MDTKNLYCVLWSPARRYVQTETLANHLASVHRQLAEGFDSRNAEVLLELCDDIHEQTRLATAWHAKLNPE